MAVNDNHSALHHAEVARRYAEGTPAECAEIGAAASARYYYEQIRKLAWKATHGNPMRHDGDLIIGGPDGFPMKLPIGRPGEAPVSRTFSDGMRTLVYRPFNMPRVALRADAGLKLYPGYEYVITPGDTNEAELVAPDSLTGDDDCRIRIIWADTSGSILHITTVGYFRLCGSIISLSQSFKMDAKCTSCELSCIESGAKSLWYVVSSGVYLSYAATPGSVLTSRGENFGYEWKPLPDFALKSETPGLGTVPRLARKTIPMPWTGGSKWIEVQHGLGLTEDQIIQTSVRLMGRYKAPTDSTSAQGDIRQLCFHNGGGQYTGEPVILSENSMSVYQSSTSPAVLTRDGRNVNISTANWDFFLVLTYPTGGAL